MNEEERKGSGEIKTIWKPIPGTDGRYEASYGGHIRRRGVVTTGKDNKTYHWKTRELKPMVGAKKTIQYVFVRLSINGQPRSHTVARLIAETWLRPITSDEWVVHRDGNPHNNHVTNLSIVNKQEFFAFIKSRKRSERFGGVDPNRRKFQHLKGKNKKSFLGITFK